MFFPKYIKIPDTKARFLLDRTQLLKDIIKSFTINIPFQNITSFGIENPGPKPTPTIKSLFDSTLRGQGGMCGHNNYSLKILLESIGYTTYTVAAKFRRTLVPMSHCVCMVKIPAPFSVDKKQDDLYFVDAGCGVPLFEPVRVQSLPHVGRAGGFDYVYELNSDGTEISRIHRGGDAIVGKKPDDYLSPQDYTIWLQPRELAELLPNYGKVYEDYKSSAFHNTFYVYRYLDIKPDNSDFKIVCVRGKELIFITRETRTVESYKTFAEVVPKIEEYFPQIDPQQIALSASNFQKIESGQVRL